MGAAAAPRTRGATTQTRGPATTTGSTSKTVRRNVDHRAPPRISAGLVGLEGWRGSRSQQEGEAENTRSPGPALSRAEHRANYRSALSSS
jgi:hypothetical protein